MDGCCVWDYSLVTDAEGRREELHRLERPFLYCTKDGPEIFFCAVKPSATGTNRSSPPCP